jgi:hypothetical protein
MSRVGQDPFKQCDSVTGLFGLFHHGREKAREAHDLPGRRTARLANLEDAVRRIVSLDEHIFGPGIQADRANELGSVRSSCSSARSSFISRARKTFRTVRIAAIAASLPISSQLGATAVTRMSAAS